jgi:organic radical activating enzyme
MTNDSRKYKKHILDTKSESFCGAKWYNATIWLGHGATTSCHHPPPHKIDLEEIKLDPSALHNTTYKKLVRKEMQEGKQSRECEYCWKIENLNQDLVSDRVYKSKIYSDEKLQHAFDSNWRQNFNPINLEIAFDNNCNFACSYCNAGFSTTWAHDIKKNGPYQDLLSDGWGAFATEGNWAHPYGVKNENNPYIEAFWKWWESDLQYSLNELRVTGGEATVSNDFWKLIDWFEKNPNCKVKLAVNTNLGIKKDKLDRLIESSKFIKNLDIYTSNESFGTHSEYIRDGLIWDEWVANTERLLKESNINGLHVMLTLNALCLGSLDKFHETIFDLKNKSKKNIYLSYNLLRFPSFQSITTLPDYIRNERVSYYQNWLDKNKQFMNVHEIDGMNRTISYIRDVSEGHSVRKLSNLQTRQNDFFNFYNQYDIRRNKLFEKTFADWPELVEWYQTLANNSNYFKITEAIEANAVDWGKEIYNEVINKAINDGLVNGS